MGTLYLLPVLRPVDRLLERGVISGADTEKVKGGAKIQARIVTKAVCVSTPRLGGMGACPPPKENFGKYNLCDGFWWLPRVSSTASLSQQYLWSAAIQMLNVRQNTLKSQRISHDVLYNVQEFTQSEHVKVRSN